MKSASTIAFAAPSDQDALPVVWILRIVSGLLEGGLWLVVAGSVVAFGSVHPWAYVPLWYASLSLFALLALRTGIVLRLRRRLGRQSFRFHPTQRRLLFDEPSPYGLPSWSFDLDRPLIPTGPILVPGILFAAWVAFQLVPLPAGLARLLRLGVSLGASDAGWRPLTVAVSDTLRGLLFLGSALLLHVVAAAVFDRPEPGRRFRTFVALLGLGLALAALAQAASGTRLIYGLFRPLEGDGALSIFGPFVNRNHFAGYMLIVVPLAFGLLARAVHGYRCRLGDHPRMRRRIVELQSPEGTALLYAPVPALAAVAALVASNSRGALLALFGVLLLAGAALRGRRGWSGLAFALVLVALATSWWGFGRIGTRFARSTIEAGGRSVVWRDSLKRMDGLWLAGSGFNTFAPAMSRVAAWPLPAGATPWPGWFDASGGTRFGYRTPLELEGLPWYREAHNDYLQVLVETGVPGLLLVVVAVTRLWRWAQNDPWLLGSIAGVVLHSIVDFDLQIPAVSTLFVIVAALKPEVRGVIPRPDVAA